MNPNRVWNWIYIAFGVLDLSSILNGAPLTAWNLLWGLIGAWFLYWGITGLTGNRPGGPTRWA